MVQLKRETVSWDVAGEGANCCGRPPILFTSITEDAESPEEHDGTEGTAQSTAETRGKELPSEAPVVTASRPPPGWPDRGVLKARLGLSPSLGFRVF